MEKPSYSFAKLSVCVYVCVHVCEDQEFWNQMA